MKKSIIALAVAGALTAPLAQADATLYGVAQFRLIDQDNDSLNADMAKTRLGVKGTVDNDIEGLTTGFQFEWEFSGANSPNAPARGNNGVNDLRKSNVYLKGAFGEAKFGKQNNPFGAVQKADVLGYNSNAFSVVSDRIESAMAYYSPEFAGFTLAAAVTADGADDTGANGNDVDTYSLTLDGSIAGVGIAVGYEAQNDGTDDTDADIAAIGLSYAVGGFSANLEYAEVDQDNLSTQSVGNVNSIGGSDIDHLELALGYSMGKTTVTYQYEQLEYDVAAGNNEKAKKNALRVDYALGSSAGVAIELAEYNDEAERDVGAADNVVLEYTLSF